jgi:hypothetical protein
MEWKFPKMLSVSRGALSALRLPVTSREVTVARVSERAPESDEQLKDNRKHCPRLSKHLNFAPAQGALSSRGFPENPTL